MGRFDIDWLNTRHHFKFADYHDPSRMGVGPLRVWNDDRIAPGSGFDPHPHRDMEIITNVWRGAVTHRDNLGNEGWTKAGDVQVMTDNTTIEIRAGAAIQNAGTVTLVAKEDSEILFAGLP